MTSERCQRGATKEEHMTEVHVLAIDLAKRSFQVCATDRGGACVNAPVLRSRQDGLTPATPIRQEKALRLAAQAPPTRCVLRS
ncbi:MAG: hypothetical protein C3F11_00240 [Methylocystaceae bacterium]|nr:MAG: hypothetical protein C3F11_00240 [Methylocystaceae bacterium]